MLAVAHFHMCTMHQKDKWTKCCEMTKGMVGHSWSCKSDWCNSASPVVLIKDTDLTLEWTLIPGKLHSIFFPETTNWTRDSLNYIMVSKSKTLSKHVADSSTAASEAPPVKQNNPLPVLWSLGGAFLAAGLFGQASAEPGHGDRCQRQHSTCKRAHMLTRRHMHAVPPSVAADEGTSWHLGNEIMSEHVPNGERPVTDTSGVGNTQTLITATTEEEV